MKRYIRWLAAAALVVLMLACQLEAPVADMDGVPNFAAVSKTIGINVLLNTAPTDAILAELALHGKVRDVVPAIEAVTMQVKSSELAVIRALPYVAAANPDQERNAGPVETVAVSDFSGGISTWNLDAINVTDFEGGRTVDKDGDGVYVAVLDTGLLKTWRAYFPVSRIAVEYARCYGGGGGEVGFVSEQPNKWESDTNSHGTHVTSTILGYVRTATVNVNGVAPMATVIPVKVLNQNGSGWSSVIARGIMYVADLKAGPLAGSPVVINMSLGGPQLDPLEQAAIDYAIAEGVIVVASAGNEGTAGMGYPGAYAPVISVAASGWIGEWLGAGNWWYASNVADPTNPANFYIADFSSRALAGQDLDVAAPGSWVVGPYQVNSGQTSYYFLGGTSMASPHVAGIVALMAQKKPTLTATEAEGYLETSAIYLAPGSRNVTNSDGSVGSISWDADATGAGLATADAALAAITP